MAEEDMQIAVGSPMKLFLYTKEDPNIPQPIDKRNANSLKNSHFKSSRPTKIIIHGILNDYESDPNVELRKAYMTQGDYNIISVHWTTGTDNLFSTPRRVKRVGKRLASFLDFANETVGLSFDTLEIIGHSYGAHCAGFTGKYVQNGKVNKIVGLDPAYPFFDYGRPDRRLASTDAVYVESIQTSAGILGFLEPIGHVTFYPNGGRSQPGCLFFDAMCSHSISYKYFAESIVSDNFESISCDSYEQALRGNCGENYSSVRLGSVCNNKSVAGIYYVPVNGKSPFGTAEASSATSDDNRRKEDRYFKEENNDYEEDWTGNNEVDYGWAD